MDWSRTSEGSGQTPRGRGSRGGSRGTRARGGSGGGSRGTRGSRGSSRGRGGRGRGGSSMDAEMYEGGGDESSSWQPMDDSVTPRQPSRRGGRGKEHQGGFKASGEKEWKRSGGIPSGHWRGGDAENQGGRGRGSTRGRGRGGDRGERTERQPRRSREAFSEGSKSEIFGSALQDDDNYGNIEDNYYEESRDYESERPSTRGGRGGRSRGSVRGGRGKTEARGGMKGGRGGSQQKTWRSSYREAGDNEDTEEGSNYPSRGKSDFFEKQTELAAADPSNTSLFVKGTKKWHNEGVLRDHFEQFGELLSVEPVLGKLFSYVTFKDKAAAEQAVQYGSTEEMTASWKHTPSRPRYADVEEQTEDEEDYGEDEAGMEEADDDANVGDEGDDNYDDDEEADEEDYIPQQQPPSTTFRVNFGDDEAGSSVRKPTPMSSKPAPAKAGGSIFGWRAAAGADQDAEEPEDDDEGGDDEEWDDDAEDGGDDEDDYDDDLAEEPKITLPGRFLASGRAAPVSVATKPAGVATKPSPAPVSNMFEAQVAKVKQDKDQPPPAAPIKKPPAAPVKTRSIVSDKERPSAPKPIPKIVIAPPKPQARRPGGISMPSASQMSADRVGKRLGWSGFRRVAEPPKKKEEPLTGPDGLPKLVGTCMDMCPLAERLDRERFKDLSVFEMVRGTEHTQPKVNHELAVKKYHRPTVVLDAEDNVKKAQPEEVRPPAVLLRTTKYLIDVICNNEEQPFSEVHGFVRDRTRGIRQDFTFQSVFDASTVFVFEKIARFHILSEHRLCEQDKVTFDAFQNQEQFDKVLISLRHMYDDLYLEGIECSNEPEFRAYYVLSHLKTTGPQTLLNTRPSVYHSEPVQFALRVWEAYTNNDYVGFFKLLKQADYLTACLMHPYFNAVRTKAIVVMNKVYREAFPIDELVRLLGFEDQEEAIDFFIHYGLLDPEADIMPNTVYFHTRTIITPESKPPVRTAYNLIESKVAGMRVSDIINGPEGSNFTAKLLAGGLAQEMQGILSEVSDGIDYESATPSPIQLVEDRVRTPSPIKLRSVITEQEREKEKEKDEEEDEEGEDEDEVPEDEGEEDDFDREEDYSDEEEAEPDESYDEKHKEEESWTDSEDPQLEQKLNMIRREYINSGLAHPTMSGGTPKLHILEKRMRHDSPTMVVPNNSLTDVKSLMPDAKGRSASPLSKSTDGGLFKGLSAFIQPTMSLGPIPSMPPPKPAAELSKPEPVAVIPIVAKPQKPSPEEKQKKPASLFAGFEGAMGPMLVKPAGNITKELEVKRLRQEEQEERARQEQRERQAREKERELREMLLLKQQQAKEQELKRKQLAKQKKLKEWQDATQKVQKDAQQFAMRLAFNRWRKLYLIQREYEEKLAREAEKREQTKKKIHQDLSNAVAYITSPSQALRSLLGKQVQYNPEKERLAILGKPRRRELYEYLKLTRERSIQKESKYRLPLDLPSLLLPNLSKKNQTPKDMLLPSSQAPALYWKLLLAVDSEDPAGDWLTAKLSRGPTPENDSEDDNIRTISLYSVHGADLLDEAVKPVVDETTLNVCVSLLSGSDMYEDSLSLECKGTSGVAFVLPQLNGLQSWDRQRKRLYKIINGLPACSKAPLLIIYNKPNDEADLSAQIRDGLKLGDLPSDTISEWHVIQLANTGKRMVTHNDGNPSPDAEFEDAAFPYSIAALKEGITWLAQHTPQQPDLKAATLRDLLEERMEKALGPLSQSYYKLNGQQLQPQPLSHESLDTSFTAETVRRGKLRQQMLELLEKEEAMDKEKGKEKETEEKAKEEGMEHTHANLSVDAKSEMWILPDTLSARFPSPERFIHRHNTVINNLLKDLTHGDLKTLSWPAFQFVGVSKRSRKGQHLPDFDWNSEERMEQINELLSSMLIDESAASKLVSEVARASKGLNSLSTSMALQRVAIILIACLRFIDSFYDIYEQRPAKYFSVKLPLDLLPLATSIRNLLLAHLTKVENKEKPLLPLPWHRIFELITFFLLEKLDAGGSKPGDELPSSLKVYYLANQLGSENDVSIFEDSFIMDEQQTPMEFDDDVNLSDVNKKRKREEEEKQEEEEREKSKEKGKEKEKKKEPEKVEGTVHTKDKPFIADKFASPGARKRRRVTADFDGFFWDVLKKEQSAQEDLNKTLDGVVEDTTEDIAKIPDTIKERRKPFDEVDFSFEDFEMGMKKRRASLGTLSWIQSRHEEEEEEERRTKKEEEKKGKGGKLSVAEECDMIMRQEELKKLFLEEVRMQQQEEEEIQRILKEALGV